MYLYAPQGPDVASDTPPEMSKTEAFGAGLVQGISHLIPFIDVSQPDLTPKSYHLEQRGLRMEDVENTPEQEAALTTPMSQEDYKASEYAVPGGWYKGITPQQAEILQTKHALDTLHQTATKAYSAHPVVSTIGESAAQAVNILNYIPFVDALRVGVLGKDVLQLGRVGEHVAQGAVQAGAFGAASQGAEQLQHGDGSVTPILASLFVGGLLGGALGHWADRAAVHYPTRVQALSKAMEQIGNGDPVDVSEIVMPTAPGAEDINLEPAALDEVENNASGESAASLEAIHRVAQEKAGGKRYWMLSSNGVVRPIMQGVDAVDTHPGPTEVKAMTSSKGEPELVESGQDISPEGGAERIGVYANDLKLAHSSLTPKPGKPADFTPVGGTPYPKDEDLAPPLAPGSPVKLPEASRTEGSTGIPSEELPKFSPANQRVFEHETQEAGHDGELAAAYQKAGECRYGR